MEMKDRIALRLKSLGLSPRAASIKAGLNTHFLQAVLSGKSESPRGDNLTKLAAALETTAQWLLDGTGDPAQPMDAPTAEIVSIMPSLDFARRGQLAEYARFLVQQREAKKDKG
jgi:transcriptional regulator with XRE-family HTH domain